MELLNFDTDLLDKPLAVTIGFFDGVHLGHQYLISQLIEVASQRKYSSAVVTFPVHPRRVLNTEYQPALLCGYQEKIARLGQTGLDYCVSMEFTKKVSELTAKEFIHNILKQQLHAHTLLIGYDHRFGHNRSDDFENYVTYGQQVGMEIIRAKELDFGTQISSSNIRYLLSVGDIETANKMLGYRYTISGRIVEGFKVGRTIGFPTANIQIWEDFKVVPAFGVYAVYVKVDGASYDGMLYIGKRPTLQNGDNISLEVNIFNFDEDLYGKSLAVELVQFVRADAKFTNLNSLVKQIHKDKDDVIEILWHHNESIRDKNL